MPKPDLNALANRLEDISRNYAMRYGIDRHDDWFLLKVQEEMGEMTQAYLTLTGRSRRAPADGQTQLAAEVADVLCQLLLFARATGVDIDKAVQEKWLKWEPVYGLNPVEN